ncbi:MAG: kelch repeat-containing protein [bacterium]
MKGKLVLVFGLVFAIAAQAGVSDAVPSSGGEVDSPFSIVVGGTEDITWEARTAAPAPARYWSPGTGVVRDTIYFLGGRQSNAASVRTIFAYDIANDVWITSGLPNLLTTRRAGAGGRIGNKIYVAGGRDSSSVTLNTCQEFDVDTKTVTAKANMPLGSWANCGAVAGGKLYVIGSENSVGNTYEYDPAANTWATKATLAPGRGWAAAAGADGKVYVTGGSSTGSTLSDCWMYDPAANTWTQKANMPGPRIYHNMVSYNDETIYVLGGSADGAVAADRLVYKYDIASNTWSTETQMITARGWSMPNVVGNSIWIAYGSNCTTPTYLLNNEEGILAVPYATDVGVQTIVAPPPSMFQGTVAPRAEIKNFGTDPQSDIPVYCRIDSAGSNVYSEDVTHAGPLDPGATAEVVFPNWSSGPEGNVYQVTFFTDLSGDENPNNDTLSRTTTISGAPPEDTIHVDGPYSNNAVGLTAGGTFYTAARLTPTVGCNVIALIFYHHDPSQDQYAFVWGQNTSSNPGPVVESIPYTGADTMWIRCNLAAPYHINANEDVWVGPRYTHAAGQYPGGVDAGPAAPQRGGFINYDGSWTELRLVGLNFNWNIRAIVWYDGGVEEQVLEPARFEFLGAAPMPVRDFANIRYSLSKDAPVNLSIYNASGSRVRTLVDGVVERGERTVSWDRQDDGGRLVANGTYFYRLTVDGRTVSAKSVVLN